MLSGGGDNVSNNSLFSPLREQSFNYNSPLLGEGIRQENQEHISTFTRSHKSLNLLISLPKTPVGSFNKSNAHTPLVSPLTMIREEDLEVITCSRSINIRSRVLELCRVSS